MRTRAFRRYKQDIKVIKRINNIERVYMRYFHDINNFKRSRPRLTDFIGTSTIFMYKTHTTEKQDSRYKIKYSPNSYYQGWDRNNNTRESDRKRFSLLIKEYYVDRFNS
jgi:hypothetical protein